jgi:hypothetical protein
MPKLRRPARKRRIHVSSWIFVRDIVNLPPEMAPAVAAAIGQKKWKVSPNPLGAIRTASHQEAKRLGIQ